MDVTLALGGISCASCVASIYAALDTLPGVSDVAVSLLTSSATLRVDDPARLSSVTDAIDQCGFEAEVVSTYAVTSAPTSLRTITLRIDGMHSQ